MYSGIFGVASSVQNKEKNYFVESSTYIDKQFQSGTTFTKEGLINKICETKDELLKEDKFQGSYMYVNVTGIDLDKKKFCSHVVRALSNNPTEIEIWVYAHDGEKTYLAAHAKLTSY